MIINKKIERKATVFWIGISFLAAYLLFYIFPTVFEIWNEQTIDRIMALKSDSKTFRSEYDDRIVFVDLNNTSLEALNSYYLNRAHHARVIRNLSAMKVSKQLFDFIFAGPKNPDEDRLLIEAARQAENVYFGMAFHLRPLDESLISNSEDKQISSYLDRTQWRLTDEGQSSRFYIGDSPLITFVELTRAAKGIGYLNIIPDQDGVFRRLPLLVQYNNAFYPSFSLKLVCDFLSVPVKNVRIKPGTITLKDAYHPQTRESKDIVIPVDKRGNMRINFVGPWGRMKHYSYSDVYLASDDEDELELWREELSGKIVLVADVSIGSTDVGKIPTDTNFPLSGVHANSIHTILTGSFLKELSKAFVLLIELTLLLLVAALSFHRSALLFTLGSFAIAGAYIGLSIFLIYSENLILPFVRPLLMIFFAIIALHIASAVANARTHVEIEKAKEIAEKDLEIGSTIQAGFFPKKLPIPPGWEIVPYFKSARQVAGDFYDVFKLAGEKYTCIVIADVCDKGVGAALFMALIRSLMRAFLVQGFNHGSVSWKSSNNDADAVLVEAVLQANNYIAKTHEDDGMFATLFVGVLNPETGWLKYVNCGHESPVIIAGETITTQLKPTGPALGAMPDVIFTVKQYRLGRGEMFFAFTDGLTDAENEERELFTRGRLLASVESSNESAQKLVERIKNELFSHIASADQFDDITMVAMSRK